MSEPEPQGIEPEPGPSPAEATSADETAPVAPEPAGVARGAAGPSRRSFLRGSTVGMAAGLTAAYGGLACVAGAYLYPPAGAETEAVFVTFAAGLAKGEALGWTAPSGEQILLSRMGDRGEAEDFVALSDVCPHLGCRVVAQPAQNRFFCPCHNGVFAPDGTATEGPPAEAGQRLRRYALELRDGALFVRLPKATRF